MPIDNFNNPSFEEYLKYLQSLSNSERKLLSGRATSYYGVSKNWIDRVWAQGGGK